jgi:hypothetical protein
LTRIDQKEETTAVSLPVGGQKNVEEGRRNTSSTNQTNADVEANFGANLSIYQMYTDNTKLKIFS